MKAHTHTHIQGSYSCLAPVRRGTRTHVRDLQVHTTARLKANTTAHSPSIQRDSCQTRRNINVRVYNRSRRAARSSYFTLILLYIYSYARCALAPRTHTHTHALDMLRLALN